MPDAKEELNLDQFDEALNTKVAPEFSKNKKYTNEAFEQSQSNPENAFFEEFMNAQKDADEQE